MSLINVSSLCAVENIGENLKWKLANKTILSPCVWISVASSPSCINPWNVSVVLIHLELLFDQEPVFEEPLWYHEIFIHRHYKLLACHPGTFTCKTFLTTLATETLQRSGKISCKQMTINLCQL